jgi:hypothetical protein
VAFSAAGGRDPTRLITPRNTFKLGELIQASLPDKPANPGNPPVILDLANDTIHLVQEQ